MHYYKYVIGNIIKCNKKLRVIGNQYNFNIIIVKFGLNLTNYAKKNHYLEINLISSCDV